jgi:hypothetical protein
VTGTTRAHIAFAADGTPTQQGSSATFDTSLFFVVDEKTRALRTVRQSISGILLGDWRVVGPDAPREMIPAGLTCLLHPFAHRPLDSGRLRGARVLRTRIENDQLFVEEAHAQV